MTNEKLLKFPCDFPIKIIGNNTGGFREEILAIVQKHLPTFSEDSLTEQLSGKDKFISLTALVHAKSQETLDNIYQDLTKQKDVVMVL